MDSLEQEGILIRHYYFDDDPRECWSASGAERFSLSDLPSGSEHRLLLCTVGSRLMDPFTGQLANWVDLLERWPERAILTPVPVSEWGSPERKLASSTIVLPGNLRGVHALVDHLETEQSRELALVRNISAVSALSSNESAGQQVFQLQKYLRTDVFTWFCACAVYPELHWDLTLEIAVLSSMPLGLLNEDNLLTMVRLPWFRAGYVADDLRLVLMTHLTGEQERDVRRCILRLIGSNPAPENTIARQRQREQAASSYSWLASSTDDNLVDGLPSHGYVALSTVDSSKMTRLNLVVPSNFRDSILRRRFAAWTAVKKRVAMIASLVTDPLGRRPAKASSRSAIAEQPETANTSSWTRLILAATVALALIIGVIYIARDRSKVPSRPLAEKAASTDYFVANPEQVRAGQSVELQWQATNGVAVLLDQNRVDGSGKRTYQPAQTTTYTLEVQDQLGKIMGRRYVTVRVLLPYPRTARTVVVGSNRFTMNDVYFEPGEIALSADAVTSLKDMRETLASIITQSEVVIEGNADEIENGEYSLAVADGRAQAVLDVLVKLGLPSD